MKTDIKPLKNTKKKQREMTIEELKVFNEVMVLIYEDDKDKEHKLWPEHWKQHWPTRDGFNVGLSQDKNKDPQGLPKRYGVFKVRDAATGKWLTFTAHREAMEHFNHRLDPQFAIPLGHPYLNPKDFAHRQHVGLDEINNAIRHVLHGVDCPRNCVDTHPNHLRYGDNAHNHADLGEKRHSNEALLVDKEIQDIIVALLRQGQSLREIAKRFKLQGWEVRRIADNAGLPHSRSRQELIDRS